MRSALYWAYWCCFFRIPELVDDCLLAALRDDGGESWRFSGVVVEIRGGIVG